MSRASSISHAFQSSVLVLLPLCPGVLLATSCRSARGALHPEQAGGVTAAVDPQHECATIDGTLAALYDVISGPAGEPRDWARFEALFHPEWGRLGSARPVPVEAREVPAGPRFTTRPITPAEYRELATPIFEAGPFFESEASRRLERYGPIAHAFSTYESRRSADESEQPFARGVNSVQLFNDGTRWWVVSVIWFEEDRDHPLPAEYLRGAGADAGRER